MTPTTLFFDLDGTLCHARTPFAQIFYASCAPLAPALESSSSGDIQRLLHAWAEALEAPGPATAAGCLARALATCDLPAPAPLVEQCAHALVADWAAVQALDAGVADALTLLGQTYPLGLITNGPSDAQHAVIRALQMERFFRWSLVSGDTDVGVRKPNAGIFERALAFAGSAPQQTWYIGDSPVNDVRGAQDAGWRACWLAPADRDFPADLAVPDARIASLGELPHMLSQYA